LKRAKGVKPMAFVAVWVLGGRGEQSNKTPSVTSETHCITYIMEIIAGI
jgi:hypothetical protein